MPPGINNHFWLRAPTKAASSQRTEKRRQDSGHLLGGGGSRSNQVPGNQSATFCCGTNQPTSTRRPGFRSALLVASFKTTLVRVLAPPRMPAWTCPFLVSTGMVPMYFLPRSASTGKNRECLSRMPAGRLPCRCVDVRGRLRSEKKRGPCRPDIAMTVFLATGPGRTPSKTLAAPALRFAGSGGEDFALRLDDCAPVPFPSRFLRPGSAPKQVRGTSGASDWRARGPPVAISKNGGRNRGGGFWVFQPLTPCASRKASPANAPAAVDCGAPEFPPPWEWGEQVHGRRRPQRPVRAGLSRRTSPVPGDVQ